MPSAMRGVRVLSREAQLGLGQKSAFEHDDSMVLEFHTRIVSSNVSRGVFIPTMGARDVYT